LLKLLLRCMKIPSFNFIILFLLQCFLLSEVHAQGSIHEFNREHGNFFHIYFSERTDVRAGYLYEPSADESAGPGSFDLHNAFFDFSSVLALSKDSFFSLGGKFESRRYLFSIVDDAKTRTGSENLYAVAFSPGIGIFLTDSILAWGSVTLGNYSDLEGGILDIDDYQLLADARLIYQINPGAQIVLGAAYTNNYLSQRLLPVIGIRLLSESGKLHISIDLPFHGRIGYYFSPYFEGFTQLVVTGDRYQARINGEDLRVGVHDERYGIGGRFWLGSYLSWTVEGGRTLSSQLRFMTSDPGQFSRNGSLEQHWYLRSYLGLAF
jgi:hypothetical protein